jgi:hypothetical protein
MSGALLPVEFADLECYAEKWCLPNEPARYAARLSSTMDELQSFYDAMFPRAEAVLDYCDQFPLAEMPEDVRHLLQLMYALVIVSFSVEAFHQPRIPDTGAAELSFTIEPVP